MSEPSPRPRPPARTQLGARYRRELLACLSSKVPAAGDSARALGAATHAAGLRRIDLMIMHEGALVEFAEKRLLPGDRRRTLRQAGLFFNRALAPLEASTRLAASAAADLRKRNALLRSHSIVLAEGTRRLEREVARRIAGEAVIREAAARNRTLLSESQAMHRRLRHLARQILTSQEEERRMISRELHDEVVQTLVGINVELSTLTKGASIGLRGLKERIAKTQRLVEHSVNAVHRFARDLRPAVLDDLGLIPALNAYCRSIAETHGLKLSLTAFAGIEGLANGKRTALFRVAQEAITNVVRHARATHVTVHLSQAPGVVRMDITDDGCSFPVEQTLRASNNKRLGLVGMRERLEMFGGSLAITSSEGKGTTVRAELPFQVKRSSQ